MGNQFADTQILKCTVTMSFTESSVIITGGSKGIGLSIAKVVARSTDRPLVLIARNKEELEQAMEECLKEGASKADVISLDITDSEAVKEIDFSVYNPGILINNTGTFLAKPLEKTSESEFENQFKVNVFGAFHITNQVLPSLKEQERGLIVNICSIASLKGYGGSGAYAASKHATLGYTRSLRQELIKTDISVTALNLGNTYSTSWYDSGVDENRLIDPADVGKLIIALSELSPRTVAEEITLMPQHGEI